MKKFYIAFAVLVSAALTSCVQEKSFNDVKLSANDVVFTFKGGLATKAAGMEYPTRKGAIYNLGKEDSGSLILEEEITNLNAMSPATKGAPAYTENVGVLYADNMGVYASGFGDAIYENMDDSQDNGGWRYYHSYDGNLWPDMGTPVTFYLRMPGDMNQHGVTLPTTGYSGGAITFTYASPATAADQRDILFAARSMSQQEHKDFLPNGAPVLFHHALTGVKFRLSEETNMETTRLVRISHVAFIGLQNSGSCTVTPRGETAPSEDEGEEGEEPDPEYKDNPTSYSSGDGTTVVWSDRGVVEGNRIEQEYEYEGFVDFAKGDGNNFADSYYEGGQTKNVNDEDGSLTFWLVPQAFSAANGNDEAELEITYVVLEGEGEDEKEVTKKVTFSFGDVLAANNVEWKPGELRTYSLKIDDVNVKIEDKVTLTSASAHYYGSKKENVWITNTGDCDVYIRAVIIGQWLDEYGDPVFGFTDFTAGRVVLVESWYQDQFGPDAEHNHGEFAGLVGYNNFTSQKWSKVGNYYYYADPVAPGKIIGTAPTGATNASDYLGYPLFTSYTVKEMPDVSVAGQKKEVYFELEIATQAVSAKKPDGSNYTLSEAWDRAGVSLD